MTGKAAVFTKPGVPMEIKDLPIPEVEPGAMLIKVSLANICGSDVHIWEGTFPWGAGDQPRVIGHEMVGRVHKLGPGVSTDSMGQPLQEGDRVVYCYFKPCGQCYVCLHGSPAACPQTLVSLARSCEEHPYFTGAFAEYYYLSPGQMVLKAPDSLSDEVLAPLNCALSQVVFGFHQVGITLGDAVVIQGAGGLGVYATAVARDMGAGTIIVIEQHAERLKLAESFGADHLIDIKELSSSRERISQVRRLTGGRGADVVAEFTGVPQAVPEGITMTRAGGKYLWVGNINVGQTIELDPSRIVLSNRTIVGVGSYDPWAVPAALGFLERTRDRYPYDKIISHKFKLQDINQAFEQAAAGKVTRATIVP